MPPEIGQDIIQQILIFMELSLLLVSGLFCLEPLKLIFIEYNIGTKGLRHSIIAIQVLKDLYGLSRQIDCSRAFILYLKWWHRGSGRSALDLDLSLNIIDIRPEYREDLTQS